MALPLEITFHELNHSDSVTAAIRDRADKLERLYPRLTGCRVSVESPHRQHRKGNLYEVHIEMLVPGGVLAITHEPHHPREKYANPDVYTTLRDAFDAAERKLLDYKDHLNGD